MLRITVRDDDTFNRLVQQVRSTTAAALENQDVPFERIISALLPGPRDISRNPLVQLLFTLQAQQDLSKIQPEGLSGEPVSTAAMTRFDMEFHIAQEVGKLCGTMIYLTNVPELETIRSMVAVFQEILRRGLEQPDTPIAILPIADGLKNLLQYRLA